MFEKQQLQGVVHLRVILQLVLNSGEHGLCLIIGGVRRCNGNRADGRSKLIVDPMRVLRSSRRASEEDRFDDGISINCIMMPNLHVRRGRGENRSG